MINCGPNQLTATSSTRQTEIRAQNWSQANKAKELRHRYIHAHTNLCEYIAEKLVGRQEPARNQHSNHNLFTVASKEKENLLGMLSAQGKREQIEVLIRWRRWSALRWHNVRATDATVASKMGSEPALLAYERAKC